MAPPRTAAVGAPAAAAVLLGVVGALVGAALAARIVLDRDAGDRPAALAPAAVGDEVPTSFGAIVVQQVQRLQGLTARAVGGVTHFPSFVGAERTQVQVRLSLTNRRGRPATYSATQFRLRAGSSAIAPRQSRLPSATLPPGATIDTELSFIAPRDGSLLRLEFADRGRAGAIVVDLGRTLRPRARSPDGEGHRH